MTGLLAKRDAGILSPGGAFHPLLPVFEGGAAVIFEPNFIKLNEGLNYELSS
jgi:hypothetical protein